MATLCVCADPEQCHARRQHRQRLADRRFDAGVDRARRDGRAAGVEPAIAKSTWTRSIPDSAGPTASAANSWPRCGYRSAPPGLSLRAYKISKRYDQDISAVFACFALTIDARTDRTVRIGCGGVAPTPVRARRTEAVLAGAAVDCCDRGTCGVGARPRVHADRRHAGERRVSTDGARESSAPVLSRNGRYVECADTRPFTAGIEAAR